MVSSEQRAAVEAAQEIVKKHSAKETDPAQDYTVAIPLDVARSLQGAIMLQHGVLLYSSEKATSLSDDDVTIDNVTDSVHLVIHKLQTSIQDLEVNAHATSTDIDSLRNPDIPVSLRLRDMDIINSTYERKIEAESEKIVQGDTSYDLFLVDGIYKLPFLTPKDEMLAINRSFIAAGAPPRPAYLRVAGQGPQDLL